MAYTVTFYKKESGSDSYGTYNNVALNSYVVPPKISNILLTTDSIEMFVDWIDRNTAKSASLNNVVANINCYPKYLKFSKVNTTTVKENLIKINDILKTYLLNIVSARCSNINSLKVTSGFYRSGYSTTFLNGGVKEGANTAELKAKAQFDKYLDVVSSYTVKNDIDNMFNKLKAQLFKNVDENKPNIITTDIVMSYYAAALLFLKRSIYYVNSMFQKYTGKRYTENYAFYISQNSIDVGSVAGENSYNAIVENSIVNTNNIIGIGYTMTKAS